MVQRHGFISYPQFLDNGFKTIKGTQWGKAVKQAESFRPIFFIANDDEPYKDIERLRLVVAHLILPLHKKDDLDQYKRDFEWIGFPNNPKLRDFSLQWFLDNTQDKKRWWLGLHDYPESDITSIAGFHGLDSTLPETYAGKFGKIWRGWRDYYKPINPLHWLIVFEINVQNFKLFLERLKKRKQRYLFEYIEGEKQNESVSV